MAIALLLNLVLCAALAASLSRASSWLGPKSATEGDKGLPYETGMPPLDPGAHPGASYYRYAILFVVFDVDLAFLAPFVLLRDRLSLAAMLSMSAFLALVGLTLAYVWRKGALES